MELTVLGAGASYPRPGGACSGFLVTHDETNVWIDAGNGTFSRLVERVALRDLDALVLTHAHSDHIADMLPLMYALGLDSGARDTPLSVYAPTLVAKRVKPLMGDASFEMFQRVFDLRTVGEAFDVGTLRFEPFQTVHPGESFGLRISASGRVLVYTSDTAVFPELAAHCRGADVLVCEATYLDGAKADEGVHMWAREAGVVAENAKAKALVLTHILPKFDSQLAVDEAAQEFSGPVEAAVEGKRYSIS